MACGIAGNVAPRVQTNSSNQNWKRLELISLILTIITNWTNINAAKIPCLLHGSL